QTSRRHCLHRGCWGGWLQRAKAGYGRVHESNSRLIDNNSPEMDCLLLPHGHQIGASAVGCLGRQTNALAERGVWVDGAADVDLIGAHLDGQSNLTDQITCMGAH